MMDERTALVPPSRSAGAAQRGGEAWLVRWRYVLLLGLSNASGTVVMLSLGCVLRVFRSPCGRDMTPFEAEALQAAIFVGMAIGGPVFGAAADRGGRKQSLVAALALMSTASLCLASSMSNAWLIASRVVCGVAVGGAGPCMFAAAYEIAPASQSRTAVLLVASFWTIGALFTAAMAWLVLGVSLYGDERILDISWRWFVLAVATVPALTCGLTVVVLPDAPPKVKTEGVWVADEVPGDERRALCLLAVTWLALSFAYFGVSTWITELFTAEGVGNDFFGALLFAAAAAPGQILSVVLANAAPQQHVLIGAMGLAAVAAGVVALACASCGAEVVGAACAFNALSMMGWNALSCVTTCSFPPSSRAWQLGRLSAIGRVGSIASQFTTGVLVGDIHEVMLLTALVMIAGSLPVAALQQVKPVRPVVVR